MKRSEAPSGPLIRDVGLTKIKTIPQINTGGDFADVVVKSDVFIDKSLFIKEIINDSSKVILITMPRRWGKSLNLDMLRRFLDIEINERNEVKKGQENDNYKLFGGGNIDIESGELGFLKKIKNINISKLVIEVPEALNFQGKIPVIFIDLKNCKGKNYIQVEDNLKITIKEVFENFGFLANSYKNYSGKTTISQKYEEVFCNIKNGCFKTSIKELSHLLNIYHNKKVWILIDEYDAATNKAYLDFDEVEAKSVSELFREIFECVFKGNPYLEKGVLTGVQYIVKSGMLSGLNNLSKHNITSTKYSKYYGIDQDEMNLLTQFFSIYSERAIAIKEWYNGYKSNIGTVEVPNIIDKYNIWSVFNYLNNQSEGFKSYWEKSGSINEFLSKLLKNKSFKESIENLINGDDLYIGEPKVDFDITDFKQLKEMKEGIHNIEIKEEGLILFYSYMFITGYLTINENGNFQIPNKEIQKEISIYLKEYYTTIFNISIFSLGNLTTVLNDVFYAEDDKKISEIFTKQFVPKFHDIIKKLDVYKSGNEGLNIKGVFGNEDLMHSLLNNIAIQVVNAKFATERHTVKQNKVKSKGRADIVLSKNDKGLIIEMKYNKIIEQFKEDDYIILAKKQASLALKQAIEYGNLIKEHSTQIFIGCNITDTQDVYLSGIIKDQNGENVVFEYP